MNRQAVQRWARYAIIPLLVAAMAWGESREQQRITAGPAWPTVEGTVSETRFRACDQGTRVEPEVTYSYTVDGQVHDGRVTFKAAHCGTQSDAQDIVGQYPLGYTLPVHVDPRDADNSLVLAP